MTPYSSAYAINDHNQVVGFDGAFGFIWTESGGKILLTGEKGGYAAASTAATARRSRTGRLHRQRPSDYFTPVSGISDAKRPDAIRLRNPASRIRLAARKQRAPDIGT